MAEPLTQHTAGPEPDRGGTERFVTPPNVAGESVRLEPGRPWPQAYLRTADDRWLRLHSQRDPIGEAERWLDGALGGRTLPDLVIVIGAGLGYVADVIERRSDRCRILILEPQPRLAQALLARRDWRSLLDRGRLRILVGPDYHGASRVSGQIGAPTANPLLLLNPVLLRETPSDVRRARAMAEQVLWSAAANALARHRFSGRYLVNTLRNLPQLLGEADVAALAGAFRDVPAVIVGAGPSLDRNFEALARCRDGVLLIACDTALKPLLAAGLAPDLVVAVDPGALNARHLQDLPPCPQTFLVCEGAVDPSSLGPFRGRTFAFRVGDAAPWPWLLAQGMSRSLLRAWGSVATSAFDLALQGGCDPIVFAGMDLAFTGHRPYARGTAWEADWELARSATGASLQDIWDADLAAKPLVHEQDIGGGTVATTTTLLAIRDWLTEATAELDDRRFLNLTGAGVLCGPNICQVTELSEVASSQAAPGDLPGRLARLWDGDRAHRQSETAVVETLLGSSPCDDAPGPPWARWAATADPRASLSDVWIGLAHAMGQANEASVAAGSRLVEWLVERRDFSPALRLLDWLDRVHPTARAQYLRGYCLHMSGQDVAAALTHYLAAAPDLRCRFWSYAHRALILADSGWAGEARSNLQAALDAVGHPRTPAACDIVEAVRARLGPGSPAAALAGPSPRGEPEPSPAVASDADGATP